MTGNVWIVRGLSVVLTVFAIGHGLEMPRPVEAQTLGVGDLASVLHGDPGEFRSLNVRDARYRMGVVARSVSAWARSAPSRNDAQVASDVAEIAAARRLMGRSGESALWR